MRKAEEFSKLKLSYLDTKRQHGAIPKTASQKYTVRKKTSSTVVTSGPRNRLKKGTAEFEMNQLPNEILFKIFRWLNVKTLLSCASVCQKWKSIANDNSFWKVFYTRYVWPHVTSNKGDTFDKKGVRHEPPSPVEPAEKYWKTKFFNTAIKIRNKTMLRSVKMNSYYGVVDRMPVILKNLGAGFEISIMSKEGEEFVVKKAENWFCSSYSVISFHDSNTVINLRKMADIKLYFWTPVMCGKDKKMLRKGPCQKSLLFEECIPAKFISKENSLASDDKIEAYRTRSGNLVAVWRDTTEIAFVIMCLHHHFLLEKCLFSNSDKMFSKYHEVILDDIDKKYGLHGYRFICQLFSPGREHCDFLFSSDVATMNTVMDGYVTFTFTEKSSNNSNLIDSGFCWKTDFFEGILEQLSVFSITAQDMNDSVIWSASSFVKLEKNGNEFVNFDQTSNHGVKICYQDDVGKVDMFFIETEDYEKRKVHTLDSTSISLSLQIVNSWFGTKY